MFECESYKEWISIYDTEIKSIYFSEKPELRKVSMLYFALQRELNKIRSSFAQEIDQIRTEFNRSGTPQKIVSPVKKRLSDEVLKVDKENLEVTPAVLKPLNLNLRTTSDGDSIIVCETPTSPIINKSGFASFKKKLCSSPSLITKSYHKSDDEQADNDTSVNFIDCSLEDTAQTFTRPRKDLSKVKKLKKKRKVQENTLTQMFLTPNESKKFKASKRREEELDELNSMAVSEILSFINREPSKKESELEKVIPETEAIIESEPCDKKSEIEKSCRKLDFNKVDDDTFLNNYDCLPEKPSNEPGHAYHEVVRGKEERKKLKGWSCKECEDYYKHFNVSPSAMDKCSKHRGKFQRDDTYAGFWNMTFPATPETPESSKTEDESLVFNFRKKK